jgi:hypothetical protein
MSFTPKQERQETDLAVDSNAEQVYAETQAAAISEVKAAEASPGGRPGSAVISGPHDSSPLDPLKWSDDAQKSLAALAEHQAQAQAAING